MSKGRGRQGEAKGYLPSLLPESVLLDPSRPEAARVIVVMVQARHTVESSLMLAPHEADQRGMRADPRAPRRELRASTLYRLSRGPYAAAETALLACLADP